MVGQTISHYRILRKLGGGGMGVVYEAEDTRLPRKVALKFLSEDYTVDHTGFERLRREAYAASALSHPNICTIYDIGDHDGQPFIVMELLEGQTLQERLTAGSPLQLQEILEFGIQIADALHAAHRTGIAHRDIKPANLILSRHGQIKVLDFGLAKLVPKPRVAAENAALRGGEPTEDLLTTPGLVLGTIAYMSPEQARGKDLDHRTDLFSFGAVLYQMATGRMPFEGETSAVIFDAILNRTPISPTQLNPGLPPKLAGIIIRALEKDRAARYQTAAEIKAGLLRVQRELESRATKSAALDPAQRRLSIRVLWVGSALVLAIVAAAVGWFLMKPKAQSTRAVWRQTTVAVLPFQNAAQDASLDYLGTALPDEVITTLSYAPELSVRPFSMSQRFTRQDSDPHQAGQQLRVAEVVTGHFLRHADRLEVTLESMDVAKDEVVWRGSVEVGMNDMLGLREEVTNALQKGLLPSLGASGGELSATKPKSQEAYELYLRSQDSAYWSLARNKDGIALLERSLALDPGYAPAWLALGAHYYNDADMVTGDQETFSKCIAAFERAHQLDPNLLSASTWLIGTRRVYGDLAVSFARIQDLARKRPRRAEVHLLLAQLLRSAGALEQAAHECEITRQLDAEFWTDCFVLYIYMGDLARARQEIERSPGEFSSFILGHVFLREGRLEEALPRLKILPTGSSNYDLVRDCLADSSALKCADTSKRTEDIFLSLPDPDAWYFGAALFAFVGRKDAAIRLLEADTKHSFCVYPSVDHDPLFDKIRRSAEFKAARQAGIECQKKFAAYAKIQIQ